MRFLKKARSHEQQGCSQNCRKRYHKIELAPIRTGNQAGVNNPVRGSKLEVTINGQPLNQKHNFSTSLDPKLNKD